jgi:nucleoid-associated protein YgaU
MDLKKLKIIVEAAGNTGKRPVFDKTSELGAVDALFNPNQLVFNKSANWQKQDAKNHDNPELQFANAEPCILNLDLLFDTYDSTDVNKKDVRDYTKAVLKLITVDGKKHRPPVCRLAWGSVGVFFQGVLEKLDQQFTLFLENGTPVRATLRCTFKEWWTNYDDLQKQGLESSDVAKVRTVKRGDSLSSIAAEAYLDPTQWRPIATANGIDDPRSLKPGIVLMIPTLTTRKT